MIDDEREDGDDSKDEGEDLQGWWLWCWCGHGDGGSRSRMWCVRWAAQVATMTAMKMMSRMSSRGLGCVGGFVIGRAP